MSRKQWSSGKGYVIIAFQWYLILCSLFACQAQLFTSNVITKSPEILHEKELIEESQEKFSYTKIVSILYEFLKSLYNTVKPYLGNYVEHEEMYKRFENGLQTFRGALARTDSTITTTGASGVMAVGLGAIAGPYILEGIKYVIASILGFFDNMYYAFAGQAIGRRALPDAFWNDLFQVTIDRLTS